MTELSIPTGRVTKQGFPENRVLNTRCVLVDTDGNTWICSGRPSANDLKPADPEELQALELHFGATWRDAVAGMEALVN